MPSTGNTRHWATIFFTIMAALPSAVFAGEAFGPMAVPAAAQRFTLGSLQLIALRDAQYVVPNDGKTFGSASDVPTVGTLLKASKLPDDRVTLSVNALLVRDGQRLVLIDSGLGPSVHGALLQSLGEAGVGPGAISDVLITHSHLDHVGGLAGADGTLAFPNAVIRMASAEWAWMQTQADAAALVKAIDGHVQTFEPGALVVPHVISVALRGHTPGHVGYEIASGTQRLLDIGDMAHSSVISLEEPEWTMLFDNDKATAMATRRAMFRQLAQSHEWVFAPHFPFPGVGHVVADGSAYAWVPEVP